MYGFLGRTGAEVTKLFSNSEPKTQFLSQAIILVIDNWYQYIFFSSGYTITSGLGATISAYCIQKKHFLMPVYTFPCCRFIQTFIVYYCFFSTYFRWMLMKQLVMVFMSNLNFYTRVSNRDTNAQAMSLMVTQLTDWVFEQLEDVYNCIWWLAIWIDSLKQKTSDTLAV